MKTYLKRSNDKSSSVFYSSVDLPIDNPSRYQLRARIVQPSTKEQHRLLSSSSPSRLQHVHWGKYGIKPLWPSDKSSCERWQSDNKQTIKQPWFSFFSSTSRNNRQRCSNFKSDYERKHAHPSNPFIPWIDLNDSLTLFICVLSLTLLLLLLLLLVYTVCRRHQKKKIGTRSEQKQTRNIADNHFLTCSTYDDRSNTAVRTLPIIIEEISPTLLSTSSPTTQLNPLTTSINTQKRSKTDTESSDSCHSSSKVVEQPQTSSSTRESPVPSAVSSVQNDSSSVRQRRSRFDQSSTPTNDTSALAEANSVPSVIVRKLSTTHQHMIGDEFTSLEQIDQAVKDVGLVRSQLIFGIDYTISNLETGKHSFNGLSLHHIQDNLLNPYQSVITIVGRTLEKFDSDTLIPAFGFGDRSTLDRKIFPLRPDGSYCKGFRGVLDAYNEVTPKVRMSGPTNFAPLIREAIRIVKKTHQYHILVIVADGQVTNERQTKDAIVEASNYPLSIVMIGVGDGPWDMMKEFDDSLPARQFDNFQFVNYNSVVQASHNSDSTFALHALMEIPSQYTAIKQLGLLQEK